MTVIELSHPIRTGMVTYRGLPAPKISATEPASGSGFTIHRISMVGNTGTYVDSPAHPFADGVDVAGLPLERLADVPGIVVRIPARVTAIDRSYLTGHAVGGLAVLVHTGWDRHFGTAAYGPGGHPHLTADAVDWLVRKDAALVGIDSVNIDDTSTGDRPAHLGLLGAGIAIVEHLTGLGALPPAGFRFHAAPPRIVGMGSFPVRAYAVV
jgi:kynurenine formamidase